MRRMIERAANSSAAPHGLWRTRTNPPVRAPETVRSTDLIPGPMSYSTGQLHPRGVAGRAFSFCATSHPRLNSSRTTTRRLASHPGFTPRRPRDAALLIRAAPPSNLSSTLLRQYGRTQRRLFEVVEHIGAGPRHRQVGRVAAGQRRPAALLYEGGLLPRADLFHFGPVARWNLSTQM